MIAAPTIPMSGSIHTQPKRLAGQQRHDGQQRGEGVGQHVQVGRLQVVIVVVPLPCRGHERAGPGA